MVRRVAVTVLAGLLAWPVQPVSAQGVLRQFFDSGPPPARIYGYPESTPYRSLYVWPSSRSFTAPPMERRESDLFDRPISYRTLCVRLCDGFYFPISSATSGSGLGHDADVCSASCGTEARLFYHPNAGGDVDTMVDLSGMAYSALPNAFKYRKMLVPECRCRPQPWSETELQRHRSYVNGGSPDQARQPLRQEGSKPAGTPSPASVDQRSVTSGVPSTSSPDDGQWGLVRPEPIVRDFELELPRRERGSARSLYMRPRDPQ